MFVVAVFVAIPVAVVVAVAVAVVAVVVAVVVAAAAVVVAVVVVAVVVAVVAVVVVSNEIVLQSTNVTVNTTHHQYKQVWAQGMLLLLLLLPSQIIPRRLRKRKRISSATSWVFLPLRKYVLSPHTDNP